MVDTLLACLWILALAFVQNVSFSIVSRSRTCYILRPTSSSNRKTFASPTCS